MGWMDAHSRTPVCLFLVSFHNITIVNVTKKAPFVQSAEKKIFFTGAPGGCTVSVNSIAIKVPVIKGTFFIIYCLLVTLHHHHHVSPTNIIIIIHHRVVREACFFDAAADLTN